MKHFVVVLVTLVLSSLCSCEVRKPNIVIIMADDLGWNDVSFHGSSEIPTPNVDALAFNGIVLNRFYTPPLCTPSRASLMTGKYPTKTGLHHYVIPSDEPWGLPLSEKIFPEYFKEAGYKTALIGKWHLGFYQKAYTPTMRGFDSHFGYLGPYIGYYDYSLQMHDRNFSRGYDLRRNLSVNYDINPKPYVTDLFTDEAVNLITNHDKNDRPLFLLVNHLAPHAGNEAPDNPLEAPEEEIEKFKYIKDTRRRTLAAMISVMDKGVGKIVTAIHDKGIMNNTIIMFFSDNGGPTRGIHSTEASNHPLRGQKGSVWEGGCRVAACIYSPLIKSLNRVSNELMHVSDILPTFAAAANISIDTKDFDGVNQWNAISLGEPGPRHEVLYNIEDVYGFSAIMNEGWKLLNGSENIDNAVWLGASGTENINVSLTTYTQKVMQSEAARSLPNLNIEIIRQLRNDATVKCAENSKAITCDPIKAPCLFNVADDPCEQNNLANSHLSKVEFLMSRLEEHIRVMVPSRRRFTDPDCDPKHFNYTWTWWQEDEQSLKDSLKSRNIYIYSLCALTTIVVILGLMHRSTQKKR